MQVTTMQLMTIHRRVSRSGHGAVDVGAVMMTVNDSVIQLNNLRIENSREREGRGEVILNLTSSAKRTHDSQRPPQTSLITR